MFTCFAVFYWIYVIASVILYLIYGLDNYTVEHLTMSITGACTFTPIAIMELYDYHKQRKLKKYFKQHYIKIDAHICRYVHTYIPKNDSYYNIYVAFDCGGREVYYRVLTNNRKAALYKDKDTLPICCVPAFLDLVTMKKTEKQLWDELGFKIKVRHQATYPMIVFEEDLK